MNALLEASQEEECGEDNDLGEAVGFKYLIMDEVNARSLVESLDGTGGEFLDENAIGSLRQIRSEDASQCRIGSNWGWIPLIRTMLGDGSQRTNF